MTVLTLRLPTEYEARKRLARLPITQPPGMFGKLLAWATRRLYGQPMDNGFAMSSHKRVLLAIGMFERRVARFDALDDQLKALAVMAVSVEIGCGWCVDFGFFEADRSKLDLAKLRDVAQWRESELYSDTERLVIEFARAATATPPTVDDELVAALRADLGDRALVELVAMVAIENQRSRINAALGLVSQGFSASCQIPAQ